MAKAVKKTTKGADLVQGRDFDAWVFRYHHDGSFGTGYELQADKPRSQPAGGEWVRVKFVEVE